MYGLFRTQMRRSAATDSGLYYDHVSLVINSDCSQDSRRDALRNILRVVPYGIAYRRVQAAKKIYGQRGRQAQNSMNDERPTMNEKMRRSANGDRRGR